MKLLRAVHDSLIRIPGWRRYQRRISRRIKASIDVPDAYGDLFAIARATRAAAILDIGSYTGDTIERFVDELSTPVYGFEPTPESFQTLARRFEKTTQVHLNNVALSDHEGNETFFCNANPQTNSLLEGDTGNALSFPEETRPVETIQVDVQTLDAWASRHLPEGDLMIKADVQGAEGRLIDGGHTTFRSRVAAFYSEAQLCPMYRGQTSFSELNERLVKDYDFCLYNTYPCLRDERGRAVQLDALWIKEAALTPISGSCRNK